MSLLPEGKWIDVEGIRTRYYEAGSGEPMVFIYGGNFGTGDSASMTREEVAAFVRKEREIWAGVVKRTGVKPQ